MFLRLPFCVVIYKNKTSQKMIPGFNKGYVKYRVIFLNENPMLGKLFAIFRVLIQDHQLCSRTYYSLDSSLKNHPVDKSFSGEKCRHNFIISNLREVIRII
jgi:hypothetical protein